MEMDEKYQGLINDIKVIETKLAEKNTAVEQAQVTEEEKEDVPKDIPQQIKNRPLIYLSYATEGYEGIPMWVDNLYLALTSNNYLVFCPHISVGEQFKPQDIDGLNALTPKIMKSMCPMLKLSEEILLPFDAAWKIFQNEKADDLIQIYKHWWFLVRSSLVIVDFLRTTTATVGQELLYAEQLDIPCIGMLPLSEKIDIFAKKSITALFSSQNLLSILPMIRGYAPLS